MFMNIEIDDEITDVAKLKSKNQTLNKLCAKIAQQQHLDHFWCNISKIRLCEIFEITNVMHNKIINISQCFIQYVKASL